ncbi:MAG: Unknown protein [uncultured Campylobacterales bacterium]|uniref:PEGA domain-containing protein n=1 Tax=uncultured Campylobacterales bacterium TaxID=352960 RepID=A0A6S6SPN4_9BACT|nr:MAG: Unknown protein [uncultured Campylobacterales bacterium]
MKKILLGLMVSASLMFASATIFTGTTQVITIDSDPQGADVYIDGESKGKTPLSVTLDKNKHKNLKISKSGYNSRVLGLDTSFNFITLLSGYFTTTDLINGAAWEYKPGSYYVELKKSND